MIVSKSISMPKARNMTLRFDPDHEHPQWVDFGQERKFTANPGSSLPFVHELGNLGPIEGFAYSGTTKFRLTDEFVSEWQT